MKFFRINIHPYEDLSYCRFNHEPKELSLSMWTRITEGKPADKKYPEDVRLYMDKTAPGGSKLADLVANTFFCLVVSKKFADIVAEFVDEEFCQFLPLSIYDFDKELASRDYFILNPLGSVECLDLERCDVNYYSHDKKKIQSIDKYVGDKTKLQDAPHLFRMQEDLHQYIISGELALALKEAKISNVYLYDLEKE